MGGATVVTLVDAVKPGNLHEAIVYPSAPEVMAHKGLCAMVTEPILMGRIQNTTGEVNHVWQGVGVSGEYNTYVNFVWELHLRKLV